MLHGLSKKSHTLETDVWLSLTCALLKRIGDTGKKLLGFWPGTSAPAVFEGVERVTPDKLWLELLIGLSIVKHITPENAVAGTTNEANCSMVETSEIFDIAFNFIIEIIINIVH